MTDPSSYVRTEFGERVLGYPMGQPPPGGLYPPYFHTLPNWNPAEHGSGAAVPQGQAPAAGESDRPRSASPVNTNTGQPRPIQARPNTGGLKRERDDGSDAFERMREFWESMGELPRGKGGRKNGLEDKKFTH